MLFVGCYSAHAVQKGLLGFITGIRKWPPEVRIFHGEAKAKQMLSSELQTRYEQDGKRGKGLIDVPV